MELGLWPSPAFKASRGRLAEPPRAGDPLKGPRLARFYDILDVSPSLDSQTTSKSDETRSTTSITKRASQRFKNHIVQRRCSEIRPRNLRKRGEKVDQRSKTESPRLPSQG